jgi:hypothetical protein
MKAFLPIAMFASVVLTASAAQSALITFEEPVLTAMSNSPGAVVPVGARLSTQFLGTLGVSFTSGAAFAAVADHGFPTLTPTPPNVLGGTNADGTLNYAAPITATFFDPTDTSVQATTDYVRVLGEWFGLGSGSVTLTAYDRFGGVLGSDTDFDTYPLGMGPVLELSVAGIHYVTFSGTSGTVAFDNFEFNAVTAVGAVVPEPGTWALLIMGFGLTGAVLRRRPYALARR